MLTTKVSPQLYTQQYKLLTIAASVTERFFAGESRSLHLSQVKGYQVWRDRTHVAIVNSKTRQLIVLGKLAAKSNRPEVVTEDLTSQSLCQKIQQYHQQFSTLTSIAEINSAWQFFRPLDPTIQNLYQTQSAKLKNHSLKIAPQKATTRLEKPRKVPSLLAPSLCLCSASGFQIQPNS